jgi:molybdate-binding protein/DNA-binding XRE family transcriptional regulator
LIRNRLKELREQRGVPAAQLAREAGVRRQTIYAIEAGDYVPNTAVSLRLAESLQVTVEDLFQLEPAPEATPRSIRAEVLSADPQMAHTGAGVRLCRVGGKDFATPFEPTRYGLPWVDGAIGRRTGAKADIEVFDSPRSWESRLLLAGCDPAIAMLARDIERATGGDVVIAPCSSKLALEWLRAKKVHVAGAHLRDAKSGEFNLPAVSRLFPRGEATVLTFARWEEGIVVAHGNPLGIRSAPDLAGGKIRLVNREPGAGSRRLLDRLLQAAGAEPAAVSGYDRIAFGHFEAASAVRNGTADACIATQFVASALGLGFVPLATERFDLVVRTGDLELPLVRALTDALNLLSFRRKLADLAGYDTSGTGDRLSPG